MSEMTLQLGLRSPAEAGGLVIRCPPLLQFEVISPLATGPLTVQVSFLKESPFTQSVDMQLIYQVTDWVVRMGEVVVFHPCLHGKD
jgi:hypothetical protein